MTQVRVMFRVFGIHCSNVWRQTRLFLMTVVFRSKLSLCLFFHDKRCWCWDIGLWISDVGTNCGTYVFGRWQNWNALSKGFIMSVTNVLLFNHRPLTWLYEGTRLIYSRGNDVNWARSYCRILNAGAFCCTWMCRPSVTNGFANTQSLRNGMQQVLS